MVEVVGEPSLATRAQRRGSALAGRGLRRRVAAGWSWGGAVERLLLRAKRWTDYWHCFNDGPGGTDSTRSLSQ